MNDNDGGWWGFVVLALFIVAPIAWGMVSNSSAENGYNEGNSPTYSSQISEPEEESISSYQNSDLDYTDDEDEPLYFNGDVCTVDCSGHEAGYEWAEEKGISDPYDCDGNSQSFIEGCESYAEEYDYSYEDY